MSPREKPNKDTHIEGRLPTEGWGPFKHQWYSICSGHPPNTDGNYYEFDVDCPRCTAGHWVNCWEHEIDHFIYENDPVLWRWWANRPKLVVSTYQLCKQLAAIIKNKNAK